MKLEVSLPLSPEPATCHSQHSMARLLEEDLRIWMVTVNILNEQLRTADKECFSGMGLSEVLTTLHRRNLRRYEACYKVSE
jgi:hypothetical protein